MQIIKTEHNIKSKPLNVNSDVKYNYYNPKKKKVSIGSININDFKNITFVYKDSSRNFSKLIPKISENEIITSVSDHNEKLHTQLNRNVGNSLNNLNESHTSNSTNMSSKHSNHIQFGNNNKLTSIQNNELISRNMYLNIIPTLKVSGAFDYNVDIFLTSSPNRIVSRDHYMMTEPVRHRITQSPHDYSHTKFAVNNSNANEISKRMSSTILKTTVNPFLKLRDSQFISTSKPIFEKSPRKKQMKLNHHDINRMTSPAFEIDKITKAQIMTNRKNDGAIQYEFTSSSAVVSHQQQPSVTPRSNIFTTKPVDNLYREMHIKDKEIRLEADVRDNFDRVIETNNNSLNVKNKHGIKLQNINLTNVIGIVEPHFEWQEDTDGQISNERVSLSTDANSGNEQHTSKNIDSIESIETVQRELLPVDNVEEIQVNYRDLEDRESTTTERVTILETSNERSTIRITISSTLPVKKPTPTSEPVNAITSDSLTYSSEDVSSTRVAGDILHTTTFGDISFSNSTSIHKETTTFANTPIKPGYNHKCIHYINYVIVLLIHIDNALIIIFILLIYYYGTN